MEELLENGTGNIEISKSSNANDNTITSGTGAHAEGYGTIANADYSHAEGSTTRAIGPASHAEGFSTRAVGAASHGEGIIVISTGKASHAEGERTLAEGRASHSEGIKTKAQGIGSHAEGVDTKAEGDFSHTEGIGTNTNGFEGAHVMGKYGDAQEPYSFNLANGINSNIRSLAVQIKNNGIGIIDMGWVMGESGYAEMFETFDGKIIDCGYFVTLEGRKVRKAVANDDYILGVTVAACGILTNCKALRWKDKYVTDEWGRVQYQEIVVPAVVDENGDVIIPEHMEKQPVLNPIWKSEKKYVSRLNRNEWVSVGIKGQILVRDNGKCRVNGYCGPNNEGIAVPYYKGFRVMERTGANQILIMIR